MTTILLLILLGAIPIIKELTWGESNHLLTGRELKWKVKKKGKDGDEQGSV